MRVLKYLLLLTALLLFGLTVFIATQNGTYTISRSKLISAAPTTVFNYVNDLQNWENFFALKTEDKAMKMTFPGSTIGKGGTAFWQEKGESGYLKTLVSKPATTIEQVIEFEGSEAKLIWTFSDSLSKTNTKLRIEGNVNFRFKIYATFTGGVEKILAGLAERSLRNLDTSLDKELNDFKADVSGVFSAPSGYYLGQRILSKSSNVNVNLRIMIPKLVRFFKKNNIPVTGKPFVIYHSNDPVKQVVDMSVCMPMAREIFIKQPSDVISGKLEPSMAVKTIIKGDYSHLQSGWEKAKDYVQKNNIAVSASLPRIERYVRSSEETRRPSEWITELFMPIQVAAPETPTVSNVSQRPAAVPKPTPQPITAPIIDEP